MNSLILKIANPLLMLGVGCIVACSNQPTTSAVKSDADPFCVDQVLNKLEIDINQTTNPSLLKDIFSKDMKLDDLPAATALLGDKLTKGTSLRPMFDRIIQGIQNRHPAVNEFLCAAVDSNLIPQLDAAAHEVVNRSLHHTFLLSELTKGMTSNPAFVDAVFAHYGKKKDALNIRHSASGALIDFHNIYGHWFNAFKAVTMNESIATTQRLRSKLELVPEDVLKMQTLLASNIIEAVVADKQSDLDDNAQLGVALAINPVEDMRVAGHGKFIEFVWADSEWESLYETWNLAFITGNVKNLHLIYPKLLIPEVSDASPNTYLFSRAESLWLTSHFQLFARANQQLTKQPEVELPNHIELAKLWGKINLRYAKAYVAKKNNFELTGIKDLTHTPSPVKLGIGKLIYELVTSFSISDLFSEAISVMKSMMSKITVLLK